MSEHSVSYRDVLKAELDSRKRQNPHYSLRAFSRDLDIVPSRLSEIFSGRQGLSSNRAGIIADRLGYSQSEKIHFVTLVEAEHSRSPTVKQVALNRLKEIQSNKECETISEDIFAIVSDWFHFAIIELSQLDNFESSTIWIARKLDLAVVETERAIQRLLRVGLLTKKNGKLVPTHKFPVTNYDIPSRAVKHCHLQNIKKAERALYLQPIERREFSSSYFGVNPDDIPTIKNEIRKFRIGLTKKFSSTKKPKTEVYALGMQLFPLTVKSGESNVN